MAKFTPYAVSALPTTGIDINGLYFVKAALDTKFTIYARKNDNSDWVMLGITGAVERVNNLTGPTVTLDLIFSNGQLSITNGASQINLDARYPLIADVVKVTGNQTIAGVKTFSSSPVVPAASSNTQAVNKGQMDTADATLQSQITALQTTAATGLKYMGDINASTNPNYPAAAVGDTYLITVPGKIGGGSGLDVSIGNMLVCKTVTAAGTQAAVGANWTVLQSDLNQATEAIAGIIALATTAEMTAGTNDTKAATPLKVQQRLDAERTAAEGKFLRYDAAQTLTSGQKAQARTNAGAADDAAVVKLTGTQTVAGVKTFSSIPVLPAADPTSDNQSARKGYVDDEIVTATAWGQKDW